MNAQTFFRFFSFNFVIATANVVLLHKYFLPNRQYALIIRPNDHVKQKKTCCTSKYQCEPVGSLQGVHVSTSHFVLLSDSLHAQISAFEESWKLISPVLWTLFVTLQNFAKYSTHSGFRHLSVCVSLCVCVCLCVQQLSSLQHN